MNIFYLDVSHEKNAQYHLDKHVVKMVTEYAQLLSTTVRLSWIDCGYKITHQNHPSAVWTRASLENWLWLRELTTQLNKEYMFRYNKKANHKSFDVVLSLPIPNIPNIWLTEFALAMPDDVKVNDPIKAYRNYYNTHKRHIASWKNREVPYWYIQ